MRKKMLSILLVYAMIFPNVISVKASELTTETLFRGEQKFISNQDSIPNVSDELIENITSKQKAPRIFTDEVARSTDVMLEKLSYLYLAVEKAEGNLKEKYDIQLSKAVDDMKYDIVTLEKEIAENGAIELTPEQVTTMFDGSSTQSAIQSTSVVKPIDTANTKYYLYGPYTIATNAGSCKYYYVTAIGMYTRSSMWSTYYIPVNSNKVSTYVDAIVNIYVGKVAGAVVGSLGWWTNFLPWELFVSPPQTHYSSTANYTITAEYLTNVKFVWCYSPTLSKYYLGVVLNSTSVSEAHKQAYVYNGTPYSKTKFVSYTVNCDNYNKVSEITKKYWEGYENVRVEYVRRINYTYNGSSVTTIYPKYAQSYSNMN